jgi:hypothetical protein
MNGHWKVLGVLALALLPLGCGGGSPPGFRISLNPATLTLRQGSTGAITLTIVPQNGFKGEVSLSLEANLPCADPTVWCGVNISHQSVNVQGRGPVAGVLTIGVGPVSPGTYDLWLRASSGSISDSARLILRVTGPDLYVIQVYRCEGTYSATFDYGLIVGCEVGNRGNACGSATVRLFVEQAEVITDQTSRSVYLCPGDRTRVEETLWGARDSLNPTRCRCQVF